MRSNWVQKVFEGKTSEERIEGLIEFNKMRLNRKKHIKKYNSFRKLHSEIINHMDTYLESEKHKEELKVTSLSDTIAKVGYTKDVFLDLNDYYDYYVALELFLYKNHKDIPSITEIYLKKNKFRAKEKIDFLNAMNDSFASLFEVIATDSEDGYVYYKDLFTDKEYKIIDTTMSIVFTPDKYKPKYIYARIITIDGISFATNHIMLDSNNKKVKEIVKKYMYKDSDGFTRCLQLYEISKEGKTKNKHK